MKLFYLLSLLSVANFIKSTSKKIVLSCNMYVVEKNSLLNLLKKETCERYSFIINTSCNKLFFIDEIQAKKNIYSSSYERFFSSRYENKKKFYEKNDPPAKSCCSIYNAEGKFCTPVLFKFCRLICLRKDHKISCFRKKDINNAAKNILYINSYSPYILLTIKSILHKCYVNLLINMKKPTIFIENEKLNPKIVVFFESLQYNRVFDSSIEYNYDVRKSDLVVRSSPTFLPSFNLTHLIISDSFIKNPIAKQFFLDNMKKICTQIFYANGLPGTLKNKSYYKRNAQYIQTHYHQKKKIKGYYLSHKEIEKLKFYSQNNPEWDSGEYDRLLKIKNNIDNFQKNYKNDGYKEREKYFSFQNNPGNPENSFHVERDFLIYFSFDSFVHKQRNQRINHKPLLVIKKENSDQLPPHMDVQSRKNIKLFLNIEYATNPKEINQEKLGCKTDFDYKVEVNDIYE